MFAGITEDLFGRSDLAAAITQIPFVHYIEKRSKFTAALLVAVDPIGDSNKMNIPLPKYDLRIIAYL